MAYQMALRDQFSGSRGNGGGHVRSQSATHILTPPNVSLSGTNSSGMSSGQQSNHSRSLSVNEIKVNGQDQIKDNKEVEAGDDILASGGEAVETESSKANQTSQAPLVVTEEL